MIAVTQVAQKKYKLEKRQFGGNPGDFRIDFEWPTQEEFAKLPAGTQLKSITFKKSPECLRRIGLVQIKMSDGTVSPEFKAPFGYNFEREKEVEFADASEVRQISAGDKGVFNI